MNNARTVAAIAALLAMTGVALGAFGTHGLQGTVSARDLATFETAVRYQMFHALGLLAVAWALDRWPGGAARWSALLLLVGTVIFSGTLYVLVFSGLRWLGAVTPLGGVCLILGWALLAVHLFTAKDPDGAP
jgi:uncharacterized membrane protein YgdD (TMEM256/DUF423 family)